MRALSDVELISLFTEQGQQDAFTTLFNRYHKKLVDLVTERLGDADSANDVVQRVFIKLYTRLEMFDSSKSAFERWLFGITLNMMRDEISAASRRDRNLSSVPVCRTANTSAAEGASDDFFAEPIDGGSLEPWESLSHAEWRAEFHDFIDCLPWHHKQVFLMVYADGLSYPEASAKTGIPQTTLKSRVRTVLNQLREEFDGIPFNVTGLLPQLAQLPPQEIA